MLHVKTPDEALEIIHGAFAPLGRPPEAVPLLSARGRVLARAVTAEADGAVAIVLAKLQHLHCIRPLRHLPAGGDGGAVPRGQG